MDNALTVTSVNKYIKRIMAEDLILSDLLVKGEISNYKYHYSGHMYFTLKDETSTIKCVMFKSQCSLLKFVPENGMKVIIKGYISVFERDGQYQLYARDMQPDGLGSLYTAFEQLKEKLKQEGLFDNKYKKPIPFLPQSIGVVTSSTGSVIRDIINVTGRRFHNVHIKVYPVAVQGESAAKQIADAIRKLNSLACVDVIIIARGGGSLEELWAFNEEIVARSIFESKIPIISAVGHETDFTIADFTADLRAPTPSAAAEMVVPEKAILKSTIDVMRKRLKTALVKNLDQKKAGYEKLAKSSAFRQPYNKVYQERMKIDMLNKYMQKAMNSNISKLHSDFSKFAGKLDALSPLAVLSRGYGVIRSKETGKIIRTISSVKTGDAVEMKISDGSIECNVLNVKKG